MIELLEVVILIFLLGIAVLADRSLTYLNVRPGRHQRLFKLNNKKGFFIAFLVHVY